MSNIPMKTIRDGNKITKVCVEDVTKLTDKIRLEVAKAYTDVLDTLNSVKSNYDGISGKFIIGKGISQPCIVDAFDEEIGNNIAFMKAKLNANIKKYRLLRKVCKRLAEFNKALFDEVEKIIEYIELDLDGIRKHNPDYLKGSENWW